MFVSINELLLIHLVLGFLVGVLFTIAARKLSQPKEQPLEVDQTAIAYFDGKFYHVRDSVTYD